MVDNDDLDGIDPRLHLIWLLADDCLALSAYCHRWLQFTPLRKGDLGFVLIRAITQLTVIASRLMGYALTPRAFVMRSACKSPDYTTERLPPSLPPLRLADQYGILAITRALRMKGQGMIRRDQALRFTVKGADCEVTDDETGARSAAPLVNHGDYDFLSHTDKNLRPPCDDDKDAKGTPP
ncbi:MAG: hypothetical protein AAFY83_04680 [Pseudomonadota bacterium]